MSHDTGTSTSIRSQGRKKSRFPARTTVLSNATFDYVAENTNFKITFSDLLGQLGATGTIVQDGALTGVPVLDTAGTVFNIRNIEPGAGISASVSPQNGITLKHNFIFDTTGEALSNNPTDLSPVLKSILGGTGIQVNSSSTTITVTATGISTPDLAQVVNTEADFPTQDATTITLEAGIIYLIGNSFSTSKRFIVQDSAVLTSGNPFGSTLTYTGVGAMFTSVDVSWSIDNCRVSSPNATQTFNLSDATNTKGFIWRLAVIEATPKVGTFTGLAVVDISDVSVLTCMTGITLAGTIGFFDLTKMVFNSSTVSFVGVDFGTSIVAEISIFDSFFNATGGGTGLSGLANNGNVGVGRLATVTNNNFDPSLTSLVGITTFDSQWRFFGNTNLPDSAQLKQANNLYINSEADFRVQDATTITLEASTLFTVGANITTAKRFICENGAAITSNNTFAKLLTYTGTGVMFTGVDANFTIENMTVAAPAASEMFNFTDTVGQERAFLCVQIIVGLATKLGTFTDYKLVDISVSGVKEADDGFSFVGSFDDVRINGNGFETTNAAFIGFDLGTAVIDAFILNTNVFRGPGAAVALTGATGNANILPGHLASVVSNTFDGLTPLSVITSDDVRWLFGANSNLASTNAIALISLSANATATVIGVVNTPVLAAGTWTEQNVSHFTTTAAGRQTYEGETGVSVSVDISYTVDKSGGGSANITTYLFLNGSIITASGSQVNVTSGSPQSGTVVWALSLVEDDFLEVFVENNSGTDNITVINAAFRAN